MSEKRSKLGFSSSSYKQQSLLKAVVVVIAAAGLLVLSVFLIIRQSRLGTNTREIVQFWENGMYDETYRLAALELEKRPMDFFLLTVYGFSSYQLALAQINNHDTQIYLDNCIDTLRKALLLRDGKKDARIRYVLGKAYYSKGSYYADLAVKYLEEARSMNYAATDISEYLGLAYAAIRDYRNSVAALSMSLDPLGPSDNAVLLAIAQSYLGLGEHESARAYLVQCIENSKDENVALKARLLLASTFLELGDTDRAVLQFVTINEMSGGNADAHFQLGEIYAAAGDAVKARAEWRNALRINPSHSPARERLNNR